MIRRIALSLIHGGLTFAVLAYAAVPGPYRALTPGLYGLANPAPNLYTDAPEQADRMLALIATAEERAKAFFGTLEANPVWVICTTAQCQEDFGFTANGLAIGYHFILIGPQGLNETVLTHERVHIALHRHLGPSDILSPRFPAWFDEGLAAHLSGDTRLRRPDDPAAARWIYAARRYSDWLELRDDADWRDRYGAAARLVEDIAEKTGPGGLQALIQAVGEGADFDTEYRAILGAPP